MPACSPCSLRHFLDDHLLNLLCSLVLVEPNAGTFMLLKVSQQHEIDIGVLLTAWQSVFGKMFFFFGVSQV